MAAGFEAFVPVLEDLEALVPVLDALADFSFEDFAVSEVLEVFAAGDVVLSVLAAVLDGAADTAVTAGLAGVADAANALPVPASSRAAALREIKALDRFNMMGWLLSFGFNVMIAKEFERNRGRVWENDVK